VLGKAGVVSALSMEYLTRCCLRLGPKTLTLAKNALVRNVILLAQLRYLLVTIFEKRLF